MNNNYSDHANLLNEMSNESSEPIQQENTQDKQGEQKFNQYKRQGSIKVVGEYNYSMQGQTVSSQQRPPGMSDQQWQQLEERRRREAGQSRVVGASQQQNASVISRNQGAILASMSNEEQRLLIEKEKKQYNSNKNSAIICAVCSLIIYLTNLQQMKWLKKGPSALWYWHWLNMGLYLVDAVNNCFAKEFLTVQNKQKYAQRNALLFFFCMGFGIWGLVETYGKNEDLARFLVGSSFWTYLQFVVWIRMIPSLCIGCLCTCVCLAFVCFIAVGSADSRQQARAQLRRMPGVNNFIQDQARAYDPVRDKEVSSCAICLEDFSETDGQQVAELNCSNKHIFHVKCLQEWVKKNDTCPMCREQVLKN